MMRLNLGELQRAPTGRKPARLMLRIDLNKVRAMAAEHAAATGMDIDVEKRLLGAMADPERLDPQTRTAAALALAAEEFGDGDGRE